MVYQTSNGQIEFNVNVFDETVWLTQKQMAELFGRDRKTITRHIINVFKEKELTKEAVCSYFEHTAPDGKKYKTQYYNLDVIISVGYRVKSDKGTQFRQWATKILKQYMLNGYTVNETRLRQIESSLTEMIEYSKENSRSVEKLEHSVDQVKSLLLMLLNRPINIQVTNNNTLQNPQASQELTNKLIELIDCILISVKDDPVTQQLSAIKNDVSDVIKNPTAKNRVVAFFTDLGNTQSTTHQAIKGAGITKKLIAELISLGNKLREIL